MYFYVYFHFYHNFLFYILFYCFSFICSSACIRWVVKCRIVFGFNTFMLIVFGLSEVQDDCFTFKDRLITIYLQTCRFLKPSYSNGRFMSTQLRTINRRETWAYQLILIYIGMLIFLWEFQFSLEIPELRAGWFQVVSFDKHNAYLYESRSWLGCSTIMLYCL